MIVQSSAWNAWHVLVSAASGVAGQRILVAIVKAMPPLPAGASWWARWGYGALESVAGLEAGSTGKVDGDPAAPAK